MNVVALKTGNSSDENRGSALADPDWDALIPDQKTTESVDGKAVEKTTDMTAFRESARQKWKAITEQMTGSGTLQPSDSHLIQRLVFTQIRYDIAIARTMSDGLMIGAPKTGVPMHNPWQNIAKQMAEEARKLEKDLGLTPAKRGKGRGGRGAGRKRVAADGYLDR